MRILLNTSLLIAGFRKPLPENAVVTAVDELEAEQLIIRGYVSKTTKDATHDHLSIKAEKEEAEKAAAEVEKNKADVADVDAEAEAKRQAEATAAAGKPVVTTAATGGKPKKG